MPDLHYVHPRLAALYDLDSPWAADTDFYLRLAGESPLDVLDLGCGTGTLALGLAAAGHRVTGVDPAPAMLDVARRKDSAGTVQWLEGRAETFESAARYDLALMTGHAFQVLLEDSQLQQTFARCHGLLRDGGRLAFESRNPAIDWERQWRREFVWQLPEGPVRQQRSNLTRERDRVTFSHSYQFPDATLRSESTLRFLSRAEIEERLEAAGFCVDSVLGDWDGSAFEVERSLEMIFVARRSASAG